MERGEFSASLPKDGRITEGVKVTVEVTAESSMVEWDFSKIFGVYVCIFASVGVLFRALCFSGHLCDKNP
jgi:hypothetical protein